MNGFLKFLFSVAALFGSIVAALALYDKFSNRNRIEGDYLECETQDSDEIEDWLFEKS